LKLISAITDERGGKGSWGFQKKELFFRKKRKCTPYLHFIGEGEGKTKQTKETSTVVKKGKNKQ